MSSVLTSKRGLGRLWGGSLFQKGLLVAAALSFGYGLISSYVNVQDKAERELALRFGPPTPIFVQNLDPSEDIGRAGELVLHAEVNLASSVVLQSEEETSHPSMMIVPLLPVSDTGMVVLADAVGGQNSVLGEQAVRSATGVLDAKAKGFVLVPVDRVAEEGDSKLFFAEAVHGEGRFGTVVTLAGEAHHRLIIEPEIKSVFAAINLTLAEQPIALYPYLDGREAALSKGRPAQNYQIYFVAAGCLVALCVALHGLSLLQAFLAPKTGLEHATSTEDEPETAPHPMFSRIPSQSEILAADQKLAEERAEQEGKKSLWGRLLGRGSARD